MADPDDELPASEPDRRAALLRVAPPSGPTTCPTGSSTAPWRCSPWSIWIDELDAAPGTGGADAELAGMSGMPWSAEPLGVRHARRRGHDRGRARPGAVRGQLIGVDAGSSPSSAPRERRSTPSSRLSGGLPSPSCRPARRDCAVRLADTAISTDWFVV